MGLPFFKSKPEQKSKTKPKSKSRTSQDMAPASNTSSLEPHSGSPSAQSNTGRSSSRHRGNSHRHRSTPSRRTSDRSHADDTNNVNGVQDDYPPQVYEPVYNSAHTYRYARCPSEEPVPVPPEASYPENQIYYSSAQFQTHQTYEPTAYATELSLEEEQAPAAPINNQQYSSYPGDSQYLQAPAPAYYSPQTPAQQYPVQQNVSTSATTADWSRQQLAAERLRLGLPRYETEAEDEAARRA